MRAFIVILVAAYAAFSLLHPGKSVDGQRGYGGQRQGGFRAALLHVP